MFLGQQFGAFGRPDNHVKNLEVVTTANGARVRIEAAENLGDAYYQVYINNVYSGAVWCPEGLNSDWVNVIVPTAGGASVVVFRAGSNPIFDNSQFASFVEEAPRQVTATWVWTYESLGTVDDTKLTNWITAGLRKIQTLPASLATRGAVPVSLVVSGGTATVNLGTIASGSGAVGTTVTLTAINNSGVSGSVDVAADAVTASSTFAARWPESMRVLRDTTSPPSTVIETVKYNGDDTGLKVDGDILDIDTYYYAFQAISDTDDIGDQSAPVAIAVTGAPEAPSDLAYTSGNAAATTIGWTVSPTAGATYNVYLQQIGDLFMNGETPTQTLVAGSTSTILPAITGYAGRAQVLVRAELGGIEELNGDFLLLDYDSSGDYISKRPNVPAIRSVTVSSGLSIDVSATYTIDDEKATADALQLFVRTPTGVYDFTTPDTSGTLNASIGGVRSGSISAVMVADGWYYVTLKTATSGGVQCDGDAPEVAVYISDDNLSAPVGEFTLSRG